MPAKLKPLTEEHLKNVDARLKKEKTMNPVDMGEIVHRLTKSGKIKTKSKNASGKKRTN